MKINMLLSATIVSILLFSGCRSSEDISLYTGIVEGETHTVSSPVSDRLIDLKVSEGDWVKEGEILGQIDDKALSLQEKGLETQLYQLILQEKDAEITLEQINENYDHYNTMYQKNLSLLKQEAVSDQTVRDLKLQVDKWNRDRRSLDIRIQLLQSQQD